jgi:hypothetical protein
MLHKWFWSICKSWVTVCDLMFSWWWPWTSLFSGVFIYEVWYLLIINLWRGFFYRSTWHRVPQKSNVRWLILFTQDRTLYHLISYSTNSTVFSFKTTSFTPWCWTTTCDVKIFGDFTCHLTKVLCLWYCLVCILIACRWEVSKLFADVCWLSTYLKTRNHHHECSLFFV